MDAFRMAFCFLWAFVSKGPNKRASTESRLDAHNSHVPENDEFKDVKVKEIATKIKMHQRSAVYCLGIEKIIVTCISPESQI